MQIISDCEVFNKIMNKQCVPHCIAFSFSLPPLGGSPAVPRWLLDLLEAFARSFVVRRTPGSFLGPKWSRYGNKNTSTHGHAATPQDVLIRLRLPDTIAVKSTAPPEQQNGIQSNTSIHYEYVGTS